MQDPSTEFTLSNAEVLGTGSGYVIIDLYSITGMHIRRVSDEVVAPGVHEELIDVTDLPTTLPDLDVDQGWYIRLAEGEKVISEGVVFLKTYYVTTFSPIKGGTLYALNYKTGVRRSLPRQIGGLISKPVVVINKAGHKLLASVDKINPSEGASESVGPGILAIEPSAHSANFFYLWWREL